MKYKVGDRVRVKSLEWYNDQKGKNGCIYCSELVFFKSNMSKFCGSILTIKDKDVFSYEVEENNHYWTDDMFEGLAEDTIQPVVFENIVFPNENYADKVELCLGNDYEIVVEDGRTFVQKKKSKYPKSFQECYYLLYGQQDLTFGCDIMKGAYGNLLECLQMLLICRDAYWRIAGEEMGLDKPWESDYNHNNEKYVIYPYQYLYSIDKEYYRNTILAVPIEEMRDAFYENFKDLIEKCKKLL